LPFENEENQPKGASVKDLEARLAGVKGQVVFSPWVDPAKNLSLEELLFESLLENQWRLLFYRNSPCVVMGKNQIPWKEIRLDRLEALNLEFFRRISGGGCVYHDLGNLNFSLMMPLASYDKIAVGNWVISVLQELSIAGTQNDRGDLIYRGKKFSGNAYRVSRGRVLHHGTLLIEADLQGIHGLLGPMKGSYTSKGVASVPSPVVNLATVKEGTDPISVKRVLKTFERRCQKWELETVIVEELGLSKELEKKIQRHRSWDWKYGLTPKFFYEDLIGEKVEVRDGIVSQVIQRGAGRFNLGDPFSL
jgi:lipoate-protein ligase A